MRPCRPMRSVARAAGSNVVCHPRQFDERLPDQHGVGLTGLQCAQVRRQGIQLRLRMDASSFH